VKVGPRLALFAVVIATLASVVAPQTAYARESVPVGKVVILQGDTERNGHAAEELAKYLEEMSGVDIPIHPAAQPPADYEYAIVVGNARNNPVTKQLYQAGEDLGPSATDGEQFLIRSVARDGTDYLVLAGTDDVTTLYAVYDYLERFCGLGFFQDGEYVPEAKEVPIVGLDFVTTAKFRDRGHNCFGHIGLKKYFDELWTLDDWKQELDWMAKRKLNMLVVNFLHDPILADPRAVCDYARSLGIRIATMAWNEEMVERAKEELGSDRYYFCGFPGTEGGPDPEGKIEPTKKLYDALTKGDRDAVALLDTWGMSCDNWSIDYVKRQITVIPEEQVYIIDISADYFDIPMYEKHDWFYGRDWAISFLNSFAYEDTLYGDMEDIIAQSKFVLSPAAGGKCHGLFMLPEITRISIPFFHLACELAWDPTGMTLDGFLEDYVEHRYGRAASKDLLGTWQTIAEGMRNLYPGPMNDKDFPRYVRSLPSGRYLFRRLRCMKYEPKHLLKLRLDKCITTIPMFRSVLKEMLAHADRYGANPLFENDVMEVARVYLGQSIDYHLLQAYYAYEGKDAAAVDEACGQARACLELMGQLLSTRKDYWLADTAEQVAADPRNQLLPEGADYNLLVGSTAKYTPARILNHDKPADYVQNDTYEEVYLKYLPELDLYHKELREGAPSADKAHFNMTMDKLAALMQQLENLESLDVPGSPVFKGTPLDAAAFVLEAVPLEP